MTLVEGTPNTSYHDGLNALYCMYDTIQDNERERISHQEYSADRISTCGGDYPTSMGRCAIWLGSMGLGLGFGLGVV